MRDLRRREQKGESILDSTILALYKEPGKSCVVRTFDSVDEMLKAVGGYVAHIKYTPDVAVLFDEDGLLKDLPYNCTIDGVDIVGNIAICGVQPAKEGEMFTGLPGWDVMNLKRRLFPE